MANQVDDMTDSEFAREQTAEMRKEAAKMIDPETAEVSWDWGYIADPYGDWPDIPEEYQCSGRLYFARALGTNIWVSFYDLPQDLTERRLKNPNPHGIYRPISSRYPEPNAKKYAALDG
jgi:hypothetical protein